jgi:hypothetical protein
VSAARTASQLIARWEARADAYATRRIGQVTDQERTAIRVGRGLEVASLPVPEREAARHWLDEMLP